MFRDLTIRQAGLTNSGYAEETGTFRETDALVVLRTGNRQHVLTVRNLR